MAEFKTGVKGEREGGGEAKTIRSNLMAARSLASQAGYGKKVVQGPQINE